MKPHFLSVDAECFTSLRDQAQVVAYGTSLWKTHLLISHPDSLENASQVITNVTHPMAWYKAPARQSSGLSGKGDVPSNPRPERAVPL